MAKGRPPRIALCANANIRHGNARKTALLVIRFRNIPVDAVAVVTKLEYPRLGHAHIARGLHVGRNAHVRIAVCKSQRRKRQNDRTDNCARRHKKRYRLVTLPGPAPAPPAGPAPVARSVPLTGPVSLTDLAPVVGSAPVPPTGTVPHDSFALHHDVDRFHGTAPHVSYSWAKYSKATGQKRPVCGERACASELACADRRQVRAGYGALPCKPRQPQSSPGAKMCWS